MAVITGKVIDAKTGKPVYNATLVFTDKQGKAYSPLVGTVTGFDGGYAFDTLGGYYLRASYMGYKTVIKPVSLSNFQSGGGYSQSINFALEPSNYQLPEVVIKGSKPAKPAIPTIPGWWQKNRGIAVLAAGLFVIGLIVKNNG